MGIASDVEAGAVAPDPAAPRYVNSPLLQERESQRLDALFQFATRTPSTNPALGSNLHVTG